MKFTLEEIKNSVEVCSYMKKRTDNINCVLLGKDFWTQLRDTLNLHSMGLVGLAVVTTKWIPTSHILFFGSTLDAIQMRGALEAVMGPEDGLTWEQVMELLKDGKRWDEEVALWQTKEQ